MKAIEQAVSLAGGQIAGLARLISDAAGEHVSNQRVWKWVRLGDRVAPELCRCIEAVAAQCHADLLAQGETPPCDPPTRYELRPDVFGQSQDDVCPSHVSRIPSSSELDCAG